MAEYSISDGTRRVMGPSEAIARKVLAVCQTNNIVSDAQFDTFLNGLTTVPQLRAVLVTLVGGLIVVTPGD